MTRRAVAVGLACVVAACARPSPTPPSPITALSGLAPITAPPPERARDLGLSPFYAKHIDVDGLSIVASPKVSDAALREAAWLVRRMISRRPDVVAALVRARVRVAVMAPSEMTTDIPEHADLVPKAYWDRRARGLGATIARPAVSVGEENLLDLAGDPYAAENVFVHELAHTIHQFGMNAVDPTFDRRLTTAYENAREAGRWRGTYAMQSASEYWAEGAQSWFDCNRANDSEHGPIDTRAKLAPYDPELAALLAEAYGDEPWRYTKPKARAPADRVHLAGFDRAKAQTFAWPSRPTSPSGVVPPVAWRSPDEADRVVSKRTTETTSLVFVNHRSGDVALDWIDFTGARKRYATLRPQGIHVQETFVGHAWLVSEGATKLGVVVAERAAGRVEVR